MAARCRHIDSDKSQLSIQLIGICTSMLSHSFCLLEPRVHSSRESFYSSQAPPVGSIGPLRKRFKRQGTTDTAPGLMSSHVSGRPTLEWVRVGLPARRKGSNFPAEVHKRCKRNGFASRNLHPQEGAKAARRSSADSAEKSQKAAASP